MGPALLERSWAITRWQKDPYDQSAELLKKELGDQHPMYVQVLDHRATLFQIHGQLGGRRGRLFRRPGRTTKNLRPQSCAGSSHAPQLSGRLVYARNRAEGEKLLQESVDIYSKSTTSAFLTLRVFC